MSCVHVTQWSASIGGPSRLRRRAGFTVLEVLIVIGILSVVMIVAAQVGIFSMTERRRSALRQEAVEAAANILEMAQAREWAALTPEWAASQQLSTSLAQRLHQPSLKVKVEPVGAEPLTKRVSVEIRWQMREGIPDRPVLLTGWFSARSAPLTGGKR